jgi:hypothetical protein
MEASRDDLKAEYTILQAQYEAFDARALTIKSLSGPLIAAIVGTGLSQSSRALIVAAIVSALALWILEAIWKSFQYCYTDRIILIEKWFRGEHLEPLAPFQIYTAWGVVWQRWFKYPKSWIPILQQPFVYLPYLPLALFGAVSLAWPSLWK